MISLKENYEKKVIPYFTKELGYKNKLAIPRLLSVTVNVGIGSLMKQEASAKEIEASIKQDIAMITGQKPIETKAKSSIAGFGTRRGQAIGLKVTLRGKHMEEFLHRLINLALPRTRDFSGISPQSVDQHGNFTIGIRDHTAFPEIGTGKRAQEVKRTVGFEITITTSAETKEEGTTLLRLLGFPLAESTEERDK